MDQELEVFEKKRKQKKIVGIVFSVLLAVVLLAILGQGWSTAGAMPLRK